MKNPNNANPNEDVYDMSFKRTLCLDFDGVFHWYRQGWKGPTEIYDDAVPGSIEWLVRIAGACDSEKNKIFDPQIYSSRSKHDGGISAMQAWFLEKGLPSDVLCQLAFPTEKPAAWLTLDDRCFQFRGIFPTVHFMMNYRPWMKAPDMQADLELLRDLASRAALGEDVIFRPGDDERLARIANEMEGRSPFDNDVYDKSY